VTLKLGLVVVESGTYLDVLPISVQQ